MQTLRQARQEQAEETGGTLALERDRAFESVTVSTALKPNDSHGGQEGDGILTRCLMEQP